MLWGDLGNQLLRFIGCFSRFLRCISGKKSLSFQRQLEPPAARFILPATVFHWKEPYYK
jgi:hypothetical protein